MKRCPLFLVGAILFLVACQAQPVRTSGETVNVSGGAYINVTAQELSAMLKGKDFVFVNVHIPFEGNIANTDLSIAYDHITDTTSLAQLPSDKNAKIVLYCRSGRMSELAAEALVSIGYTNIWNLAGGMLAWEQAGYEVLR